MIDIDIDSNDFGGFAGVKADAPSKSRFVVQMCSVPRVGEQIYVSQSLMPEICFTGPYAPTAEVEGLYAGYVALEVVMVSHQIHDQSHRPYLLCKRVRAPFGST